VQPDEARESEVWSLWICFEEVQNTFSRFLIHTSVEIFGAFGCVIFVAKVVPIEQKEVCHSGILPVVLGWRKADSSSSLGKLGAPQE